MTELKKVNEDVLVEITKIVNPMTKLESTRAVVYTREQLEGMLKTANVGVDKVKEKLAILDEIVK